MTLSPLAAMQQAFRSGALTPAAIAAETIRCANSNASRNVYLHFDPDALIDDAQSLPIRFPAPHQRPPLYGVPISLKDCFDLAGTVTTLGTHFHAAQPAAVKDSAIAQRLKACGALITGKTHLHPLAYGITGQNPDFADCLQPRDPTLLTGGSSSGAAASVQEGSALVAIGTDTGGSIRVPAALCGLVGYRSSHALANSAASADLSIADLWTGGHHLAPTFDTIGFLLQDPRDAAPVAEALFGLQRTLAPKTPALAATSEDFLLDATPEVIACFRAWKRLLQPASEIHPHFWSAAPGILNPIQASEAAAIHHGHFDQVEDTIAQRLRWGAGLSPSDLTQARRQLAAFRADMAQLFAGFDLLMLPASPTHALKASSDHTGTRTAILRYTSPFSLCGLPVITLPGEIIGAPRGTGVQIAAAAGEDATLLAFAEAVGQIVDTRPRTFEI